MDFVVASNRILTMGLLAGVLAAALLAPSGAAGEGRVVVRDYITADGQVTVFGAPCPPELGAQGLCPHQLGLSPVCKSDLGEPAPAVSAACVDILPGETTLAVALDDAVNEPVYAFTQFRTATGGGVGGRVFFCGSTVREIPAGATSVQIALEPSWAGLLNLATGTGGCTPNFGTVGTITATFT